MSENKLSLLFCYLILVGYVISSEAYPDSPSFPGRENGTCHKRVPYDDALKAEIVKGTVHIVPGSEIAGVKTSNSGWITIADCCPGYKRVNESGLACEIHCEGGCVGGKCTGPNVCSCEDGWVLEGNECKPICRRGCGEHAYCFGPEICSCEFGYQEVAGLCRPVCLHDCANGDCVAPRVCRCHPGYYLNETKWCEPLCEGGCPHGHCERPGICSCDQGYVHPPNTRENCVAYCPDSCKNGKCHSPGRCTCDEGYSLNSNDFCVPQCENGCANGECVAPNQCYCNSGYIMNYQSQECVEYVNGVLHQNFTSYNETRDQQNVYKQNGQWDRVRETSYVVPHRVIGLNETNRTQSHQVHQSQSSYTPRNYVPVQVSHYPDGDNQMHVSINQEHESQGHYPPQKLVPSGVSYESRGSFNQRHELQEPYPSYKHTTTQEPYTAQTPNQRRDPYKIRGSYKAHETDHLQGYVWKNEYPSYHSTSGPRVGSIVDDSNESSVGINMVSTYKPKIEEIHVMPEAHIIITPHSVSSDKPSQKLEPTYIFAFPEQSNSGNPYQAYNTQKVNVVLTSDQSYIKPDDVSFTSNTRELIDVNINQHNYSESTSRLNHQIDNKQKPSYVSDESDETKWYDKNVSPYDRQQHVSSQYNVPVFGHTSCKNTCINGQCVGNGQCKCRSGYKPDPRNPNGNICVPLCTGGCLNGVCSAPNLCLCNPGFTKENGLRESQRCIAVD